MLKTKRLIIALMLLLAVLLIPNMVNAAVDVTRDIYSNNGSMKFNFTGLTLDKTHEYEYGLTKTVAEEVKTWHLITENTETTAVIDIMTTSGDLRNVINAVDTGYITIKDRTTDTVILQPYDVDLKIPYLNLTNYTVINNGKEFDYNKNVIQIALRCASNSEAYYQYEKITDQNIINKYKEIKANNGDFNTLQSILTTKVPNYNWTTWKYWNGYDYADGMNGYGHPQSPIKAPDTGLYYLWVYFSGNNLKPLYGYILVDNLEPEIALDSISLPKTKTVELGKTLTLTPTFNPSNATNKIVTWTSSDETVATVDNAGKITPKKVGSTIITVTSQDGNKKATCTVTVTSSSNEKIDTKQYISFPFIIYNGKSSVSLKSGVYDGKYTMYYQFVEVSDEVYNKLNDLKTKYENKEITYEEYFVQYNKTVTKYNDSKWIKTADGSFEQDLSKFTGTKKFALWVKLVMEDKTVYEAQVYTMNGSGQATNEPQATDKQETSKKDTTTATSKLPNTGKVLLIWTIAIVAVSGIVAHIRYKKLYIK